MSEPDSNSPVEGFGAGSGAAGAGSAGASSGQAGSAGTSSAAGASSVGAGSGETSSVGAGSAAEAPTTAFPAATANRSEGRTGGVSTAPSGSAAGSAAPMVAPTRRRGPLQSVLVVRRIDPWSTFTTVLGLMFALFVVWMVAIGVVYLLLSGMGVWDRLDGLLSGVAGDSTASAIDPSTIFLYAGGVGLLNVLLLSVLSTLAVFIYNLAAGMTGGGIQVTLADRTERGN